jgi:hypothetical protein
MLPSLDTVHVRSTVNLVELAYGPVTKQSQSYVGRSECDSRVSHDELLFF